MRTNLRNTRNYILKNSFKGLSATGLYFKDKDNTGNRAEDVYADIANETGAIKIAPAFAYAKNNPSFVTNFPYHIAGNKLTVAVPPPVSIINNLASGDVVIDPLVQSSGSVAQSLVGTMFNATCGFTNSCDYTIPVTPPANATITTIASLCHAVANALVAGKISRTRCYGYLLQSGLPGRAIGGRLPAFRVPVLC